MANYGLEKNDQIKFGGALDTCHFCTRDYVRDNRVHPVEARNALAGKLEGQLVFNINRMGEDIVVCKDCIKKINDILNPSVLEEKDVCTDKKVVCTDKKDETTVIEKNTKAKGKNK